MKYWTIAKQAVSGFIEDGALSRGAAIALKIPLILNEAVNIDEEGLLPHEFYELLHERPQSRLRHSWCIRW